MGAAHRHRIAERLMAGGMSPATPVLAVQWGTEPQQASVRTTLAGLSAITLGPPLTMVIGEVAGLDLRSAGPLLPSGEPLPLSGKTVVVTRAALQASPLAQKLRRLGARVLEVPTIALAPPADGGRALLAALDGLEQGAYPGPCSRSANAVERFFEHVPDTRLLGDDQGGCGRPGHGRRAAGLPGRRRPRPHLFPGRGLGGRLPCCAPASRPHEGAATPGRRRPSRVEGRAEPTRMGRPCRRGLPYGPPGTRARLVGGRGRGRRRLLRFFFGGQQLP